MLFMRCGTLAMLALASMIVGPLGAQAPSTSAAQSAPSSVTVPPLTLTGCVTHDDKSAHFTLSDEAKRGLYELTGADMRPYLGARVQVKGESLNRLHVVGGLWPTPNVAAQAGAIDPAQAAVAALPGGGSSGTGSPTALEFHVVQVSKLNEHCP